MKNPYTNLKRDFSLHNKESLFNTVEIEIRVKPILSIDDSELQDEPYSILEVIVADQGRDPHFSKNISEFVQQINNCMIEEQRSYRQWKIFYLIKELIQHIEELATETGNFSTYYRGQKDNWDVQPGILRDGMLSDYLDNFESIYQKISNNYPEDITYYEYTEDTNCLQQRAQQLSLLQHYGLRTSLVDITRNPYIAMLFMIMNVSNGLEHGTLDCFLIDEIKHSKENVFMAIPKSNHNKRLDAQDGAFFNYDMLKSISSGDMSPINNVRIVINCSKEVALKNINDIRKKTEDGIKELEKDLMDNPEDTFLKTLKEMFDQTLKNIRKDEKIINTSDLKIPRTIQIEFKRKLKEYYYEEKNLFPDLDKFIQYIQSEYSNPVTSTLNK